MMRRVVVGLLFLCAFQPAFGNDFKFKVTPSKDFTLLLEIFGGPLMMLDACWSSAKADLDWVVLCDYPSGTAIAAVGESDEEKCEDIQVGIFGGNDGLLCAAALISASGTGKGNGAFRFTGTESNARRSVRAAPMSLDELPEFRAKIEEFKAKNRKLKNSQ